MFAIMRFLLFTLAAMIVCDLLFAQETTRKFAIGVSISPDYNYRTLSNNDGSSSSGVVIDVRNDIKRFKIGYTSGLNLAYLLNNKLEFEAGILLSDKGYRTKKEVYTYYSQFNGNGFSGPVPDGAPSSGYLTYDYYAVDVPLRANINFGTKRLRWCIGAGLAANIFLVEKVRLKAWYPDGHVKRSSLNSGFDYNGLTVSPQISAGINYRVSEKVYIKAEPTARYGVAKIIDAPVTGHLWNVGLNVGFYLKP